MHHGGALEGDTAVDEEQRRRQKVEGLGTGRLCLVDRRHDLPRRGDFESQQFDTVRPGGVLQRLEVSRRGDIGVGKRRNAAHARHRLDEYVLSLAVELGRDSKLIPVMLPPGRASDAAKPSATMSSVMPMSGMVRVSVCRARNGSSGPATMASGAAFTMVSATLPMRSIATPKPPGIMLRFPPSTKPWARNSSKNATIPGVLRPTW